MISPIARHETVLRDALEGLPRWSRAVFAALCAERLVHALNMDDSLHTSLKRILDELWIDLSANHADDDRLASAVAELPVRPSDQFDPDIEDAVATVAFALATRMAGSSQEAVWAARRVQDVIFRHVEKRIGEPPDLAPPAAQRVALNVDHWSPPMQSELKNEREDLAQLGELARYTPAEAGAEIQAMRDKARMNSASLLPGR